MARMRDMGLALLLSCGLLLGTQSSVRSADLTSDTALRFAAEDVDTFIDILRLKEQAKQILESKFVRALRQVPYVQKSIEKLQSQWENREGELGRIRDQIENPNALTLIDLAKDMFSDEVFFIADSKTSDFVYELMAINNDLTEIASAGDPTAMAEYFFNMPKADFDAIPLPSWIVGFKIADQDRVLTKLDELEGLIRFGVGSVPVAQPFLEGLKRVEDSRGTRLQWTVTADMIPWQMIPPSNSGFNADGRAVEKLQEVLSDREVCISIGQLDGYLVLGVSESADAINNLGGGSHLADNPALQPLMPHADKPITAITYVSDVLADANWMYQFDRFFSKNLGQYYRMAELVYGEIPPAFQSIPDDLAWIDEQIAEHVPDYKGMTGFSYLIPGGYEAWTYNRTEDVIFDAEQPLEILEHVGGEPMAVLAMRLQNNPQYFETARKIVRKIKEYLDEVPGLGIVEGDDLEAWEFFLNDGWPVLVRLADLWEEEFMPALEDGQHAWVFQGGNLSNTQWMKDMPESPKPLPLPEFATIAGVSNKTQLVNAFEELFNIFDDVVDMAKKLEPEKIPDNYTIPRPTSGSSTVGDLYLYPIPDECPVPPEMAPQVLLTDNLMISTYSEKLQESLAARKPLKVGMGLLTPRTDCSSFAYIDFGKIFAFSSPWVEYGVNLAKPADEVLVEEDVMPTLTKSDVLDMVKAFSLLGRVAAVTTQNSDGSTLTHSIGKE